MKRVMSFILAVILFCYTAVSASASELDSSSTEPNYVLGLQSYLKTNNDEYLLRNENYAYWLQVEEFESDIVMWELLNSVDFYIECGTEPNVQKYTEVLVNIIATYDRDNASDIAEQYKNDNKKSALDYTMDVAKIGADAVDLMIGMDKSASDLEEWISIAVSGLSTMGSNIDNWIGALSDIETIVQNYTSYDMFLALIEEKATGDLKIAASNLRTSMETAMKLKLDTYGDVLDENFENYTEFFFTDVFFDALKLTSEYDSDENFKVLVDCGSEFSDKIKEFFLNPKKAWDLGVAIGTLVGNVAVGGEDVINRLHELMALCDIGNILCLEIKEIESTYTSGEYDRDVAERYFALSNYLIGCRLRGEYCRYSIVACDSGLLSKFSFEKVEDAAKWYEKKSAKIMEIRNAIKTACNAILVHNETNGYEVGELSEWYIYDESGSLYCNYTLRITSKEKMHVGAIIADDFSQPIEYVVTTPDPLLLELDSGYWYNFEIVDNANTENSLFFTVAVNQASEGLIEMIEIFLDEKPETELTGVWVQEKTFDPIQFIFKQDGTVIYCASETQENIYTSRFELKDNELTINLVNLDNSGVTPVKYNLNYENVEGCDKIYLKVVRENIDVSKLYGYEDIIEGWYCRVDDNLSEKEQINYEEAYKRIIDKYIEACAVSEEEWFSNLEYYNSIYDDLHITILERYHTGSHYDEWLGEIPCGLAYRYYDIDKNGIPELLLFELGHELTIFDIYTFDGQNALRVFSEYENEYTTFSVYTNGIIARHYPETVYFRLNEVGKDVVEVKDVDIYELLNYQPLFGSGDLTIIAEDLETKYSEGSINIDDEIQEIRNIYNEIQNNIANYTVQDGGGGTTRYIDNEGNIRKIIAEKGSYSEVESSKEYSVEYYYQLNFPTSKAGGNA